MFLKKNGPSDPPTNAQSFLPSRGLRLQFPPDDPANGAKFADQFVQSMKDIDGVELDYSPESLHFVDKFVQQLKDEGKTADNTAETLFIAGAYVGEVIVRTKDAEWVRRDDANLPQGFGGMPIMIKLKNGKILEPIGKVFKRLRNGEVDNIAYFYKVLVE